MFKIRRNMVCINFGTLPNSQVPKLREATARSRRSHSEQLARIQCARDYRLNSFLPRTIPEWNILTEEVVRAETLGAFASGARKLL